jgi:hypothetical protein
MKYVAIIGAVALTGGIAFLVFRNDLADAGIINSYKGYTKGGVSEGGRTSEQVAPPVRS